MSIIENGYLNLNIDTSSERVVYIEVLIHVISLLLQCTISILAIIKMRQCEKINMPLRACFAVSSFCACFCTVSNTLINLNVFHHNHIVLKVTSLVWSVCYAYFFISLLCTFILKLYLTFKASIYRMSMTMIRLCAVIVLMCIIISIMFSFSMFFFGFSGITFAVFFFGFFVYGIGCCLAAYAFISTLLRVAKAQETTYRDLTVAMEDIKLKPQQKRLADLAMKSTMLFTFQMGSTFTFIIVAFAFPPTLWDTPYVIDMTINLFCAYLQFAFAEKQYQKCCGFCDEKFEGIMLVRIKRRIFTHCLPPTHMMMVHSRSMASNTHSMDSIESPKSPST